MGHKGLGYAHATIFVSFCWPPLLPLGAFLSPTCSMELPKDEAGLNLEVLYMVTFEI